MASAPSGHDEDRGSQTLTATDTVTGSIHGSASLTVNAGAATHFTVSEPASATAGAAFQLHRHGVGCL